MQPEALNKTSGCMFLINKIISLKTLLLILLSIWRIFCVRPSLPSLLLPPRQKQTCSILPQNSGLLSSEHPFRRLYPLLRCPADPGPLPAPDCRPVPVRPVPEPCPLSVCKPPQCRTPRRTQQIRISVRAVRRRIKLSPSGESSPRYPG